jgi:hypothetical protein
MPASVVDLPDPVGPEHHAGRAALPERVDPEPPEPLDRVGEVRLAGSLEVLDEVRAQHLADHVLGVVSGQLGRLELAQATIDAHPWRGPDLDMQVRTPRFDQGAQVRLDGPG